MEDSLNKLSGDLLYLWENHYQHRTLRELMEDIFSDDTIADVEHMRIALNNFLDDQGF